MADILLKALSGKPGASDLTLIDGTTDTGYRYIGAYWGLASFERFFSGQRGTQGARLVGREAENLVLSVTLEVTGSTNDQLQSRLSTLFTLIDECDRFGGKLTRRPQGGTRKTYPEVLAAYYDPPDFGRLYHHNNRLTVVCHFVCPPYAEGDPCDFTDDFATDRVSGATGEYTFDSGAVGNVAVTAGELDAVANLTTENRAIHTAHGYAVQSGIVWLPQHTDAKLDDFAVEPFTYRNVTLPEEFQLQASDRQVTVKSIPGSTITSYKAGVVLTRIDSDDYLEVYVDDDGVNSRLRLDKVVAGARTNLSSTNLGSRIANGTPFWVRGRIERHLVHLEHFTSAPTPMGTPTTTATYQLTSAEQTAFLSSADPVIGDAPALAEVHITHSGGAAAPIWALIAWWERGALNYNQCWNGDFDLSVLATNGWSVAAVTNINGAATSITRITTASKYAPGSGEIVCPATADTGANFRIFRKFKRGVTYTLEGWIQSAAEVTNVYCRLGNGAANDKASSSNTPLSTAWQRITVTWTPSADRGDAHLAFNIAAATATTFRIDGVMVYEGAVAPTSESQKYGRGGYPPIGILEGENSAAAGSVTSGGDFRSGFAFDPTGAVALVVDPALLIPDDHTLEEITIEVWARVELTTTSHVLTLKALAISNTLTTERYAIEYGSAGVTVQGLSAGTGRRFMRLGTLLLPTNLGRWFLEVFTDIGPDIDYVVCVPRSRVLSPSGKANDANFPDFIPGTSEITKRILPDLAGTISTALGEPEVAHHGLGGALFELPPGDVDSLVKLSSLVPNDPTSDTTTEQLSHAATVHFAVTPRYHLARST